MAPQPHRALWLFSWQTGEGGQAGRSGRVGWAPQQPLPPQRHTLMHMHTPHPPADMHDLPNVAAGARPGLHLPNPRAKRKEPLKWGMWRPLAKPGPSCTHPAVSRGPLARSHKALLLAPLPVNRTLRVGGKEAQARAQASGQQRGDVFGSRSQGLGLPRHGGGVT